MKFGFGFRAVSFLPYSALTVLLCGDFLLILLAVSIFIFFQLDFAFLCAWLLGLVAYFIK